MALVEQVVAEDEQVLREVVAADVANRTLAGVVQRAQDGLGDHGYGSYALGWQVDQTTDGWDVFNSVPYAGVIELGRRPMRPGPPLEPILAWVKRVKPGLDEAEQASMAEAVRWKIHVHGSPPRRFLGDTVDEHWDAWIAEAVYLHLQRRRRT